MTPEQREEEWRIFSNVINNTTKELVDDNRGWRKFNPFSKQIKFGKLKVIDQAPSPPIPTAPETPVPTPRPPSRTTTIEIPSRD